MSGDLGTLAAQAAPHIATAIVSILGTGGLWTYLTRRQDRTAEREKSDNQRLREDLAAEKASHKECIARFEQLERRLAAVEDHHGSLFARWIKDAGKRVCWVNGRAMATIFGPLGYTRDQVEGRTFQDLLDVDAAREIDRLDRAALAQPGMAVSVMVQLHHRLPVMIVVKVAGVGRDQELIYEGHAYHLNDPDKALQQGERRQEEQLGLSQLRLAGPGDDAN